MKSAASKVLLWVTLALLFGPVVRADYSTQTGDHFFQTNGGDHTSNYGTNVTLDVTNRAPKVGDPTVTVLTITYQEKLGNGAGFYLYRSGTLIHQNSGPGQFTGSFTIESAPPQTEVSLTGAVAWQDTWVFQVAVVSKKVRISYVNSQSYPVKLKIVDADNSAIVIATLTVPANTGFSQEVTLPSGTNNALVLVLLDDWTRDGPSWVVQNGAVTEIVASPPIAGVTGTPPTTNVTQPGGLPSSGPGGGSGGDSTEPRPDVWNPPQDTANEEILDKRTYREGVDKTVTELQRMRSKENEVLEAVLGEGLTVDMDPAVELPTVTDVGAVDGESLLTAENMATSFSDFFTGSLPSSSSISCSIPWAGASRAFTIDLSHASTVVGWFRSLLSCIVHFLFWFLLIRTARSAVADQ